MSSKLSSANSKSYNKKKSLDKVATNTKPSKLKSKSSQKSNGSDSKTNIDSKKFPNANNSQKFASIDNPVVNYLSISDDAISYIKELLKARKQPCDGVKITVRTRGCSGMSYKIEYAEQNKNISKFDDVVEKSGIKVFIDPKISMFLIGSEMIYKTNELESGFDFINPNEKGRCGCGESFKV